MSIDYPGLPASQLELDGDGETPQLLSQLEAEIERLRGERRQVSGEVATLEAHVNTRLKRAREEVRRVLEPLLADAVPEQRRRELRLSKRTRSHLPVSASRNRYSCLCHLCGEEHP